MSVLKEFLHVFATPVEVNDSRFGLRKLFLSDQEQVKDGVYMEPGRGSNGESNG